MAFIKVTVDFEFVYPDSVAADDDALVDRVTADVLECLSESTSEFASRLTVVRYATEDAAFAGGTAGRL